MESIPPRLTTLCIEFVAKRLWEWSVYGGTEISLQGLPGEVIERLLFFLAKEEKMNESLLKCYPLYNLEVVKIPNCTNLSESSLGQLISACPRLTSLHLTNCNQIHDSTIETIVKGCPLLSFLDVSSIFSLTNNALFSIAKHTTRLEELNLLKCRSIDGNGLIALSLCTRLKKLNIGWCRASDIALIKIMAKCKKMESLDLWLVKGLTSEGLIKIASLCGGLKKINLWALAQVNDDVVRAFSYFCTKMESINFQALSQITDSAFRIDANYKFFGGSLKKVCLTACSGIGSEAVSNLATSSKNLQKINLAQCAITDDDVRVLAESCPHLIRLDLEGTDVSTQAVESVAMNLCRSSLKSLVLWGCPNIDDDALNMIASSCYSSLCKLHLVDCQITDVGLKSICETCKNIAVFSVGNEEIPMQGLTDESLSHISRFKMLRGLELYYTDLITDRSLSAIFRSCFMLKKLHLSVLESDHTRLTDQSICLIQHLPFLTEVELKGLLQITDAAIIPIVQKCRKLVGIELESMPLLTKDSWSATAEHCPKLRNLMLTAVSISTESLQNIINRCTKLEQIELEELSANSGFEPSAIVVSSPHLAVSVETGTITSKGGWKPTAPPAVALNGAPHAHLNGH